MAGFPKDGGYLVPRTHINVNMYTQKHGKDPIDLIFPLHQAWQQQQSDLEHGDQNICAQNLLFETLPFLAEVVIQDGMYWVRDFPNHEATCQLPPDYAEYAHLGWQYVKQQEQLVEVLSLQHLNKSAQQCFHYVTSRLENLQHCTMTRFDELQTTVKAIHADVQMLAKNMSNCVGGHMMVAQPVMHAAVAPPAPNSPSSPIQVTLFPIKICDASETAKQQCNGATVTINDGFCAIPCRPAFPAPLPKTITSLLLEFQSLKLTEFERTIRSDWPKVMQVGYNRRLYLFKFIQTKAAQI